MVSLRVAGMGALIRIALGNRQLLGILHNQMHYYTSLRIFLSSMAPPILICTQNSLACNRKAAFTKKQQRVVAMEHVRAGIEGSNDIKL